MIRVVGPRLPHVVDCRGEGEPCGHRYREPGDPAPGADPAVEGVGPELYEGEDRRAGAGRGGPPRGLPHEAAGDGFVEYPRERPLGCHPERDDREVEQERGRSLPGGGWSSSEPRETRRDAAGRGLDDILGGGREQVVERGVEPGDDALVRPAPRGQRRGEGPGDDEGRDQQSGLRRPPG